MAKGKGQKKRASTSSQPLKRKLEQAEDKEWGSRRPQKINRALMASNGDHGITATGEEQLPVLVGMQDEDMPKEANMVDNEDRTPESDHALSTNSYDIWLNLPDVPFNVFMMSLSITDLRRLTQVSSSWKNRITETFLKNPANQKTLRARIDRKMCPGMLPSNEEMTNAMWLSKYL